MKLEQYLQEIETLADRAEAEGLTLMATALMLCVRCARQRNRNEWMRLLTIVCTALELCPTRKRR